MKRGSFFVCHSVGGKLQAVPVYGWIDGDVGYYNDQHYTWDRWFAIDLPSGVAMHEDYANSRAEAIGLVQVNAPRMEQMRRTKKYATSVSIFADMVSSIGGVAPISSANS